MGPRLDATTHNQTRAENRAETRAEIRGETGATTSGEASGTRYEQILRSWDGPAADTAAAIADAAAAARTATPVRTPQEAAVRDVAAGVAAPALVGYVLWVLHQARELGLQRLCFLSRDAQVLHEIAQQLAPRLDLGADSPGGLDLRYVHSSRRTWSLAAADTTDLAGQDWLFNSFMRSNAADVCARLGLPLDQFAPLLEHAGASLDPDVRADQPEQAAALRRFTGLEQVADAVAPRIQRLRALVRDYAAQEHMASTTTGLVDAGWTGRMIGALTTITAGLPQPKVFFWAHEPRTSGWTDPARLLPYMYDTATGDGMDLRVPDTPYIIETFCMPDHGIIADYTRDADGHITGVPEGASAAVQTWAFTLYRQTIRAFCEALDLPTGQLSATDLRPIISRVLHAFWITPTRDEATAWGAYPYDSDPLARATRPLAAAFDSHHLAAVLRREPLHQQDRAWLQGSLALSGQAGADVADLLAPRYAALGAPATD